ncbi:uncharacterized protein LOC112198095 isoform X2 [Rosa chinensis]|uniref:uncharacterized protein LOC112198095 isoform X2 n=1 Tax=Rosa chinensis TaxID=74649 RepID=UPI000D0920BD|nr:uncharacterized protein LOC112198095 isoform X2 [Rosa chinensis]
MDVYPKVKVRQQEEKDDQHALLDFSTPVKDKDVSPATVAKVPKSYVPRVVMPSISVAEGAKKANKIEEMNKQNIRASSIPPPRAVLSSPDNDTVIGNKNRIKAQRPSALKNHSLVQNRSTPCIPLHITENSINTKKSKGTLVENCLKERKGSASKLTSQIRPSRTGKSSSKENNH